MYGKKKMSVSKSAGSGNRKKMGGRRVKTAAKGGRSALSSAPGSRAKAVGGRQVFASKGRKKVASKTRRPAKGRGMRRA